MKLEQEIKKVEALLELPDIAEDEALLLRAIHSDLTDKLEEKLNEA